MTRPPWCGAAAVWVLLYSAVPLRYSGAQVMPEPSGRRMAVAPPASPDTALGKQATAELRSRLNSTVPFREVYILPGQAVDDAVARGWGDWRNFDARGVIPLATLLRADLVVNGGAERTRDAVRLHAALLFDRDPAMSQPLRAHTGAQLPEAVAAIARAIVDALRQQDGYRRCRIALAAAQYVDAERAAADAITAFPDAVPSRVCLARAIIARNAPADSIAAVRNAILARDSTNTFATGASR